MPSYQFVAANAKGHTVKGFQNAVDENQLNVSLRSRALYLLQCEEVRPTFHTQKMKSQRLADFNLQLGMLLSAGIPLSRAIEIMLQRDLKKHDRLVYESIYDDLMRGIPLSEAMARLGSVFPELLINMYRAGESNGTLDITAMKMADHYEKEQRLQSKIRSAAAYPTVLLCLLVVVMIIIFNFILPRFLTMYGTMELPALTRGVIAVSRLFTDYLLFTIIGILAIIFIVRALYKIPSIRIAIDRLKIELPVLGKLMRTIYTARFSRTLSSLYSSGLAILNALQISRGTVGNAYIEEQFEETLRSVRNGNPLSQAIGKIDGYDPKLASTVLIGEETGKLDAMLDFVADSFDYEAGQATARLTTIIEPMLIIFMALCVGLVMISVMLPIYNLYGVIAG